MKTVRIVISGRVQGVGYRAWAKVVAEETGLTGWVRNRRDGSVETMARGPDEAVRTFTDMCRAGPAGSSVRGIAVTPGDTDAVFSSFDILPTE